MARDTARRAPVDYGLGTRRIAAAPLR